MTDISHLTGYTRIRERGLFRKRMVVEVELRASRKWRDEIRPGVYATRWSNIWRPATKDELDAIDKRNLEVDRRKNSDLVFKRGWRVRATRSSFHRGCTGRVVFQEPRGGIVWVQRDGAGSPCYFYADELDVINNHPVQMRS